jgi:hypothetical protein
MNKIHYKCSKCDYTKSVPADLLGTPSCKGCGEGVMQQVADPNEERQQRKNALMSAVVEYIDVKIASALESANASSDDSMAGMASFNRERTAREELEKALDAVVE